MRALVIASSVAVACGGPQPADPLPTAVTPDAGAAVAVIMADAASPPPDAAPPPPDAASAPAPTYTIPSAPRAAVKGKAIKIVEEQEVRVTGGIKLKFDYASHKHGGDESLGMWGFIASKGGKKEEFELRSSKTGDWQAEVAALGKLLVFTHVSYSEFTVTAVSGKLPKLLDPDAALQTIEDAATAAGLPLGDSTGYSDDNGIGHVHARDDGRTLWHAYIGLYTRRIWFRAP